VAALLSLTEGGLSTSVELIQVVLQDVKKQEAKMR